MTEPLKPLATPADVTVLLSLLPSYQRPEVTDDQLANLIGIASTRLRQRAKWVDSRMALYETNPGDPSALDPRLVASVVANIVRRVLTNPMGYASETRAETIGPYTASETGSYVNARSTNDSTVRGEIYVSDADIASLGVATKGRKLGSIRVRSSLS